MSRKALRDFYKLEQERQQKEKEKGEELDEFDAQEFISQASQSDLITLVKSHRDLVEQRQVLDSEQKALIYNNYKKLIEASEKLDGIDHQGQQPLSRLCTSLEQISAAAAMTHRLPLEKGDFEGLQARYVAKYGKF